MNHQKLTKIRSFQALIVLALANLPLTHAQSSLLESVKQNPEEAVSLCRQFKDMNNKGISATSQEATKEISKQRNLSAIDAEILSIYVIGLYCPNVR